MTAGTVLVLSGPEDATADSVVAELVGLGAPIVRMDIGDFPLWMAMTACLTQGTWRGELISADRSVDLAEVKSVYYRRPTRFTFEDDMSDADAVFAGAEAQFGVGGVLAALEGVLWVNNPAQVAFAEYKPVQLRVAADCGLHVPRTLITNDHGAAREFAAAVGGEIVCKTLSSVVLSEGGRPRITYTTPIDPATIDPLSLAATAHLLQEWVPKSYDARVTMVGHRPFAVAIHADNDAARIDWRVDYDALTYAPLNPPEHIITGMIRYLQYFALEFGAFDFTVTPRGDWVFLECNPSGQWLWLQEQAGLPIAAALAELLAKGSDQ
ncbi:MAG: ATP-grasp ribosomal peptide maturase [Pseudonocardiaceae bacterium]